MHREYPINLSPDDRHSLTSRALAGVTDDPHDNTEETDVYILNDYPSVMSQVKLFALHFLEEKHLEYLSFSEAELEDHVELILTKSWASVTRGYLHEDTLRHHHEYAYLSFVFYPKKPPNSGELIMMEDGKEQRITVDEETLIIFDSHQEHWVEPNHSMDNRISIAGDLLLTHKSDDPKDFIIDTLPPIHTWRKL